MDASMSRSIEAFAPRSSAAARMTIRIVASESSRDAHRCCGTRDDSSVPKRNHR
jgi:hypothetical protein